MKISVICRSEVQDGSLLEKPQILLPDERSKPEAQALFAQVRESNSDFLCHCCTPPARMFIRYSHNHFHIVNHPILGKHREDCPLYTHVKGYIDRGLASESDTKQEESFALHRAFKKEDSRTSPSTPIIQSQEAAQSPQVREPKITQLLRYLIKETFSNWYYPNKSISVNKTLMNFKIQAQNVRFGKTTLDRYLFFGHDGFKFCLRTLNRDLKSGKWEGPGRPHALVFFVTEEVNLKEKYIYFDGISYGYQHTNTKKALETKGPYLIALSVTHEEHEEANAKLKPTSLYIQPIASKTNIFPIESDLERHFFTHIAKEIDERSLQKWSIQKVLLPKAALLSETASPDYLLQQKNRNNKVAYRCLINIRNDTNNKSYREPVSLDIWRANERITLDGDDIKVEVSRIFQS